MILEAQRLLGLLAALKRLLQAWSSVSDHFG